MYRYTNTSCQGRPTLMTESEVNDLTLSDLTTGSFGTSDKNNNCECLKYEVHTGGGPNRYKLTKNDMVCPVTLPSAAELQSFPGKEKEIAELLLDRNCSIANAGKSLSPKVEHILLVEQSGQTVKECSISEIVDIVSAGTNVKFDIPTSVENIQFITDLTTLPNAAIHPKIIEGMTPDECRLSNSCIAATWYGHVPAAQAQNVTWYGQKTQIYENETVVIYNLDGSLKVPLKQSNLPLGSDSCSAF